MKNRRPRLTLAATAAAVALTLCGCASSATTGSTPTGAAPPPPATPSPLFSPTPYPTGTAGTLRAPLPDPATVNGQDAGAVGRAAVTVMFQIDTAVDVSPRDATVRAAPYLTTAYAAELASHQAMAAPGAQWGNWTAHDAYTIASVTLTSQAGAPADTTTEADRTYTVTTTAHGRDGYTDTTPVGTAFVVLARNGADPWRVSTIQIR
ncbi:hypothetical protein ACIOJE_34925 [Kitasatospora sp. NPDC087861]|uniref:hypothetical protein n=1 Tax=Kitasatospora sp. NPDC087861 TaxID=3364070 RepID=UPI00380DA641